MTIDRLLDIMAALRDPENGCPWDQKQDFLSISPYTIEEAYEVADAIAREDYDDLRDELGDLLLQVVFHAQMAKEAGLFTFDDIVRAISEKMLRRHPHVFAAVSTSNSDGKVSELEKIDDIKGFSEQQDDESKKIDEIKRFWEQQGDESKKIDEIKRFWESEKARERAVKNREGLLDGIALNLPALSRALKLQKRAATVGFDWPDVQGVVEKLAEEAKEFSQAIDDEDPHKIQEELGDLLFTCVNLARWLKLDAESSLRGANKKFEYRLKLVQVTLENLGKDWHDCSPNELEGYWNEAKQRERG